MRYVKGKTCFIFPTTYITHTLWERMVTNSFQFGDDFRFQGLCLTCSERLCSKREHTVGSEMAEMEKAALP